jgi:DNA-binding NarL/FixJ family response regulator
MGGLHKGFERALSVEPALQSKPDIAILDLAMPELNGIGTNEP